MGGEAAEEPLPRSIVLVGDTQCGKTTFLRAMLEVLGEPIPETLRAGDGNESTTREPTLYSVDVPSGLFVQPAQEPAERPKAKVKRVRSKSLGFGLDPTNMHDDEEIMRWATRSAYKASPMPMPKAARISLKMLDTPGCDDTEGRDEEHMVNITRSLCKMGEVSAFVFLVRRGPFSESFQRRFRLYWNWLSDSGFNDRFAVVHTFWDRFQKDYTAACKKRITSFKKHFPDAGTVEHIFVESSWKDKMFCVEQTKALFCVSLNKILVKLQELRPVSCRNIHCMKTENMRAMDSRVAEFLSGTSAEVTTNLAKRRDFLAGLVAKAKVLDAKVEDTTGKIAKIDLDLTGLDTTELEVIGTKLASVWHFWGWTTVEVQTEYDIQDLTFTTRYTGVRVKKLEVVSKRVGRATFGSGPCPRGGAGGKLGDLVAKGWKRDVHRDSIVQMRSARQQAEKELQDAQRSLKKNRAHQKEADRDCRFLERRANSLEKVRASLFSERLSIQEFTDLYSYYTQYKMLEAEFLLQRYVRLKYGDQQDILECFGITADKA